MSKSRRLTNRILHLAKANDQGFDFEDAVYNLCELFEKHERLDALVPILEQLSSAEFFWRALWAVWAEVDNHWPHREALLELMTRHGPSPMAVRDMNDDPQVLTVYRGCSRDRVLGISWTTSREFAEAFAQGFRNFVVPDPVIATAQISRRDVFDYGNHDEDEVVVNPAKLQSITVTAHCRENHVDRRPWVNWEADETDPQAGTAHEGQLTNALYTESV